jgi:hypothetical protein
MPDPEEMQSLDWFKFGIEKVTSVFGVTPVFVSIIESGRAGNNPRMQLDVQNRTIQEIQRSVVSALNHQLLERLKIYDWELTFKDIELRDELRQVQIHEIRARAAERWLAGGFQVKIDPNTGDLIVSGEGKPPAESPPEARGVPGPHISEESGAILEKSRFFSKAKPTIPGGPEHTEPDWTRLAIKEERSLARKLRAILLHYRDRQITREGALKLGEETITKHRPTLEEIALTKYNQMLRRMLPARERRGFESLKELPPEALRRITAVLEGALIDFRSILGDAQSQA